MPALLTTYLPEKPSFVKPRASEEMESILQRGEGRVKRLEGQLCLLLRRAGAAATCALRSSQPNFGRFLASSMGDNGRHRSQPNLLSYLTYEV